MDVKAHLKELIDSSEALKTLTDAERQRRINAMMTATEEQMTELIKIFEEEKLRLKQIDEDYYGHEAEINAFISEAKLIEKQENRKEMLIKEKTTKANDDKYAEDLLKKLDEIV